jgi:hypothetical protein
LVANFIENANKRMARMEETIEATTTKSTGIGSLMDEYSEIGTKKCSPRACERLKINRFATVAKQVINKPVKTRFEGYLTFIQFETGVRFLDQ